ncbi:MAG: M48 family metalloprotease [Desulfobulbaceae bacterium]|nr:M48 family metalloprotease [Desulfobulbaceae bacterium]HIJ90783.1 M48 family metalloprotease [Deltaproteobacteria bacterium]
MNHNKTFQRLTATILCTVFLLGNVPLTGFSPPPAQAFSIGEEREVGEKLLSIIRKEFTLLDDPDLTEYVTNLGRQTLQLAGPQFFNYHFFIIDNKEFNAFAAPSGLIFFHSGLIDLCDTEGELVSVLAHEIGHAASRHIADRINKSGKLNATTTALMLAGLLLGQGALSQALVTGSMAGGLTANLKFSREDEEEADRLAYKWMLEENRDPADIVNMLKKMRRVSRYHRKQVPTYLLTHPEPENRIGYIEDIILQDPQKKIQTPDEFAYQRFKYRTQALTRDTQSILPILKNKAEEPGALRNDPMIFFGLSQAYLANRDYPKAEETLLKVITRYPDKQILKTDLGRIKLEAGETKSALEIFQEINRVDPEGAYNTYYLAKALQQAGKAAQAVLLYESLSERLPTYAKLYQEIGKIRASLGDTALGHYNLALYHYYEGSSLSARYHLEQATKGLSEKSPLFPKIKELKNKIDRIDKM